MSSERAAELSRPQAVVQQDGVLVTAGKDLAVSALSAALAHFLHHPLYTLKSQMMYYGPQFSHLRFLRRAWREKSFLYRGKASQYQSFGYHSPWALPSPPPPLPPSLPPYKVWCQG